MKRGFKNYSVRTHSRVQELHAAGWRPAEIRRIVLREQGICPSFATVKTWTDPAYAARRSRESRENNARYRRERRGTPSVVQPQLRQETKITVLCELRDAGLTIGQIGIVARVIFRWDLTENQIRRLLAGMGVRERSAA